jgi:hypothetical protein
MSTLLTVCSFSFFAVLSVACLVVSIRSWDMTDITLDCLRDRISTQRRDQICEWRRMNTFVLASISTSIFLLMGFCAGRL